MLRQLAVWALLCTAVPFACPQKTIDADTIASDAIEYSISPQLLNEIVVTASSVINTTDRKIIRPNKEISQSSTNGVDLLRKLHLPRIAINPLTNEIAMVGGGAVMLCINGVEATSAQISAILPSDIVRMEFYDNPGVRYTGADAVINYITARHNSGGNLMLDAFGAFSSGRYASIDHFAGQYNRGRSVWNVNVGFMGQQKDKWIRDYEEIWNYPEAPVCRKETGLPVKVGSAGLESIVNYNYLHPRGDVFNLRLGFDFNDVPNKEQGDRHTVLETSESEIPVIVTEHTEEHSIKPNIGLYYIHQLDGGQNLTFDLKGSYMRSHMAHDYAENGVGEISRVNGNKYTVKFLGMYENRKGSRVWNVGVSNNTSVIHNVYLQSGGTKINVTETQSALVCEYSNRFGNWGTTFNLRATYDHLKQESRSIGKLFVHPTLSVSYRPFEKCFMRYSTSLDYIMPGASEISEVSQPVQDGMIRRGNPALNPFRVINQSYSVSYDSRYISVEAVIDYRNEHDPIMESTIFENRNFVRTYFNQKSFQRLRTGISLSVRPWKDHLSITAEPMLTRYFSHGIDYRHCHNIFRIGWKLDFSYGHWLVYANIMGGSENRMYGEEIIEEKDMNQIMAGYRHNAWSIHLGVFNAFLRNYWMETRNLSALTPYRSKAHSGRSSSYLAVKFNVSFDFGRKGRYVEIHELDGDNGSGILTGTK